MSEQAVISKLGAFVAMGLAIGSPCAADTITDSAVQFEFESNGSDPRVCHLMALIMNIPRSPEAAKLSLTYAESKAQKVAFVGFALDVGDTRFNSGLPAGISPARLSSAEIFSGKFSTTGRLFGGPVPDGGIMMSTQDPDTAGLLMGTFFDGNFQVTFTREGSQASRAYLIRAAPDPKVARQFVDCARPQ